MRMSLSPLVPRKMLPAAKPTMMTGIRMVVITKPRVRMRSKYSRCAMIQTLRMEAPLRLGIEEAPYRLFEFGCGRGVDVFRGCFLNLFDEYLFERGFGDLEVGDTGGPERG